MNLHTENAAETNSQTSRACRAHRVDSDSQLSVSLLLKPRFIIRELAAVSDAKIHTVIHLTSSPHSGSGPSKAFCQYV